MSSRFRVSYSGVITRNFLQRYAEVLCELPGVCCYFWKFLLAKKKKKREVTREVMNTNVDSSANKLGWQLLLVHLVFHLIAIVLFWLTNDIQLFRIGQGDYQMSSFDYSGCLLGTYNRDLRSMFHELDTFTKQFKFTSVWTTTLNDCTFNKRNVVEISPRRKEKRPI